MIKKRGYDIKKLEAIIETLARGEPLPPVNKDHNLIGNYVGCRECHISLDWLLIYEVIEDELILHLLRTGTHKVLPPSFVRWLSLYINAIHTGFFQCVSFLTCFYGALDRT